MPKTRALAVLIFDEVEALDFCGPFEVFSVAARFSVARLLGEEVAVKTAGHMEYPWGHQP